MRKHSFTLLILLAVSALFSGVTYLGSQYYLSHIVKTMMWNYGEMASQYDVIESLKTIEEEIEKVEKLANHPNVTGWSRQPGDSVYQQAAHLTLETVRPQLSSENYFIVLDRNFGYYFSSPESLFVKGQTHYHVEPSNPEDAWYFEQRSSGLPFALNVGYDEALDVTKLWINYSIIDDGEFLGLIGTGADVTPFIDRLLQRQLPGISTVFVDHNLNVQLGADALSINNVGVTSRDKIKLRHYFSTEADYVAVEQAMLKQAKLGETSAILVNENNKPALASVRFIKSLNWYQVTFVDVAEMVPSKLLVNLKWTFIVASAGLFLVLFLYVYLYHIRPVNELVSHVQIKADRRRSLEVDGLSWLSTTIDGLVRDIDRLEYKIQLDAERKPFPIKETILEDPLTGLVNRQGLVRELKTELARNARYHFPMGLIHLELIPGSNRELTPELVKQTSNVILKAIRGYDTASRWKENAFCIFVRYNEHETLPAILRRLESETFSQQAHVSIVGVAIEHNSQLDVVIEDLERAAYQSRTSLKSPEPVPES